MTDRDKQIEAAAKEYYDNHDPSYDFHVGAKWADKFPDMTLVGRRTLGEVSLANELQEFKDGVQTFKCPSCGESGIPFYEVNLQSELTKLRAQLEVAMGCLVDLDSCELNGSNPPITLQQISDNKVRKALAKIEALNK